MSKTHDQPDSDPDPWKRDIKKRAGRQAVSNESAIAVPKSGRYSARSSEKPPTTATGKKGKAMAKNDEDRYVVQHEGGWAVKKENAARASGVFRTQKEAIDRAREIVNNSGGGKGEIRIQGRDGKFRDSDSGSKNETRAKDTK